MNAEYKNLLSGAYERITVIDVVSGETIAEVTDDRIRTSDTRILVELKQKKTEPVDQCIKTGEGEMIAGFIAFWKAYPNRKAKVTAQKAWKKLNPDRDLRERIMQDIQKKKESEEWNEQRGKFIPYPASYLNGRRWEDEPDPGEKGHGYEEHKATDQDLMHLLTNLDEEAAI